MIVLSPEIVFMIREYERGIDVIELSSRSLEQNDKRFFYRRLAKNLRFLEAIRALKVEYISNRKIEVKVLDRRFLDFLRRLVRDLNYRIDFELNFRALKMLNYLHISPYVRDIRFFAALFGVTTKGVKKTIVKLRKLGLIDEKLNVTNRGTELLSYICRSESLCKMLKSRINPFLSLRLIETPIIRDIVDSIYDMIISIINLNKRMGVEIGGVVLFAFESDARVMNILRGLSRRMTINNVVVPVLVPEERLCRILTIFGRRYDEILAGKTKDFVRRSLKFCEIRLLLEFLGKFISDTMDMVFIAFSSPVVAYIIDEYVKSLGRDQVNMILLPTIDKEILNVSRDAGIVYNNARQILPRIVDAISEGGEILIRWNTDSAMPSEIRIESPGIGDRKAMRAIRVEDGRFRDKPLYLPLGEIRVDLCELARHGVKVHGKIFILGEPIVGLKLPSEEWVERGYSMCEASLLVAMDNGGELPTISGIDTNIGWLKCLAGTQICQLHIGLNEAMRRGTYELISPILTRTTNFIHFWIVDKRNETYYQLIVKNAEIGVDSRVIWRTIWF